MTEEAGVEPVDDAEDLSAGKGQQEVSHFFNFLRLFSGFQMQACASFVAAASQAILPPDPLQ